MNDERSGHVDRGGPGDDHDGIGSPGAEHEQAAVDESLAADLDQGLGLAEAAALARGQKDSGDTRLHGPRLSTSWCRSRCGR